MSVGNARNAAAENFSIDLCLLTVLGQLHVIPPTQKPQTCWKLARLFGQPTQSFRGFFYRHQINLALWCSPTSIWNRRIPPFQWRKPLGHTETWRQARALGWRIVLQHPSALPDIREKVCAFSRKCHSAHRNSDDASSSLPHLSQNTCVPARRRDLYLRSRSGADPL
jgi:hypothetical protein